MPPEELHPSNSIANPAAFVNAHFVQNYLQKIEHSDERSGEPLGRNFVRKFLPKLLWNQPNVIELQEISTYRGTISWKHHYLSVWVEPIIGRAIIFYLIYSHLKAFLLVSGVSDGNTT